LRRRSKAAHRRRSGHRPKTKERPFKSTVITAYLLFPAHLRIVPPSPPPPNVIYNACAGVALAFTKRIKLKRPAADLFFFDGSHTPPRRFWPPPGKSLHPG
jgi:hypothetical protein